MLAKSIFIDGVLCVGPGPIAQVIRAAADWRALYRAQTGFSLHNPEMPPFGIAASGAGVPPRF